MQYARFADLYDTVVRTTVDLEFFLHEARRAKGEVLELMAGTGRLSIPLLQAGVPLTCVDLSPEMLSVLREKLEAEGLRADVIAADICALDLGRQFDLILIPFHSFSELVEPEQQRAALGRIGQHLAPGGRFICTLHNPRVRLKTVGRGLQLWGKYPVGEDGGTLLFWGFESPPVQRVVEGVELFEWFDAEGRLREKRMMDLRFAVIERDEFEALAAAQGFAVEALYGDYQYAPFTDASPFMVFVLKHGYLPE